MPSRSDPFVQRGMVARTSLAVPIRSRVFARLGHVEGTRAPVNGQLGRTVASSSRVRSGCAASNGLPASSARTVAVLPAAGRLPELGTTHRKGGPLSGVSASARGLAPTSAMHALRVATSSLISTARALSAADATGPSLLPDWSRAHVLSHLACNAEGGSRLLEGVVSGTPGWEYRDLATRATDIELGARAPVEVLVARVEETARRFDESCAAVQDRQWATLVTWTTGHQNGASEVVMSRLFEVEIHHVDLAAGRRVDDWSTDFVATVFEVVARAFATRSDFPPMTIELDDVHQRYRLGTRKTHMLIEGNRVDVLAWLLGRASGSSLAVVGQERLPEIPKLY